MDEYLASGVGAALAGPVGGPMSLNERSQARASVEQMDKERADEEARQQAEQAAQEQARLAEEERLRAQAEREARVMHVTPTGDVVTPEDFENIDQLRQFQEIQAKKIADLEEQKQREAQEKAGQAMSKKLEDLTTEGQNLDIFGKP